MGLVVKCLRDRGIEQKNARDLVQSRVQESFDAKVPSRSTTLMKQWNKVLQCRAQSSGEGPSQGQDLLLIFKHGVQLAHGAKETYDATCYGFSFFASLNRKLG